MFPGIPVRVCESDADAPLPLSAPIPTRRFRVN